MTDNQTTLQRLEWSAIWRAALSVATMVVPLALLQQWLRDSGRLSADDTANLLFFIAIMVSGAIGGFGAAKLAAANPLQNGAAAAALASIGAQLLGAMRRLATGEDISSPVGWIYLALLMATCGMMGAALERRTKAYRDGIEPAEAESDDTEGD